ncbi:MAG: oligopeptide/dipeptide ABC transporter ATP-binding protein [Pseudomonadota bacterium]
MALLEVEDLTVRFRTNDGTVQAVNGISFAMEAGDNLAIVGESGSGKSQTAFAIMGLLARNGEATGSVRYDGQEILNSDLSTLNRIRAAEIAMVFQDPMTSLNPYMRVSDQMAEVLIHHQGMGKRSAIAEAVRMLDAVHIPSAAERVRLYPHEFSGGMRQRVMIAMALLARPKLLIADEPTTALDVTVQAQILDVFTELRTEFGMAVILITHDLGVVAGFSDDVIVMYGGRIMERATTDTIFSGAEHPYTRGLLAAIPRIDHATDALYSIPGNPPNMLHPPDGCPFAPRCSNAGALCATDLPLLETVGTDHTRACFHPVKESLSA